MAIAKETGRRLGIGTNKYPSSLLLGRDKDENEALPVDELIEKADGFTDVFPGTFNSLVNFFFFYIELRMLIDSFILFLNYK